MQSLIRESLLGGMSTVGVLRRVLQVVTTEYGAPHTDTHRLLPTHQVRTWNTSKYRSPHEESFWSCFVTSTMVLCVSEVIPFSYIRHELRKKVMLFFVFVRAMT